MPVWFRKHWKVYLVLVGVILLYAIASSIQAEDVAFGRRTRDCCQPVPPCLTPEATTTPSPMPSTTPREGEPSPLAFENPDERAVARASVAYVPPMLGDILVPSGGFRSVMVTTCVNVPVRPPTSFGGQFGFTGFQGFTGGGGGTLPPAQFKTVCTTTTQTISIPSAGHGMKIADDNSPRPQDRVFLNYNYYNDVNGRFDVATGSPIGRIDVHREIFGFEKTFLDGNASIELRLPLNTLNASGSSVAGLGGTFTDLGDLSVILKGILWENRETGNLLSAGLAVTPPTGPSNFAGVGAFGPSILIEPSMAMATIPPGPTPPAAEAHDTLLQPFVGYIYNLGDFFVHGFSALDIPTASNDVTFAYQDFGVGYYLFRDRSSDRILSAVVPTVELHLNTPLNHRGSMNGPLGTPDWADLTSGMTFEFCRRSTLAVGVATPITGPKPYDVEALVQLNIRF